MVGKYLHFTFSKLRVNAAWRYKVPVLITLPYIVIALWQIPVWPAIKYILFSLATIIGIAAYAYLLNDWADIEKDHTAGKANAVASLSKAIRVLLLAIFFGLAIMPWFFFPFTKLTIGLLALELVLFAAYSFPPFRLKEKPLLGVLADTLYAHVLPCLLAALTFIAIANETASGVTIHRSLFVSGFLGALCAWQFFLGLRNILFHQIEDANNDMASGTTTLVTSYGTTCIRPILITSLILETIALLAFLYTLGYLGLFIAVAYILHLSMLAIIYKNGLFAVNTRSAAYRFLDDFYYQWLALPILLLLCTIDIRFAILAALHILLFNNALKDMWRRIVA